MISSILLIATMGFIAVISYKRPRFEQRVIKNIPLIDWIIILIVPLVMYVAVILMLRNIMERRRFAIIDFDDFNLIVVGLLFMIYGFMGNSIHFVGKVLSRYLKVNKRSSAWQVNELFHGKLSHYLAFVCSLLLFFSIALLEFNYPLSSNYARNTNILFVVAGIIFGISASKAVFYTSGWFGGYNKPLFFLTLFLQIILLILVKIYHLNLNSYPANLFIQTFFLSFTSTFIVRQILIFTRLGKKRRLQFLAKIFSA